MFEQVSLSLNEKLVTVPIGTTVAAALILSGMSAIRRSVTGSPRGPLCGMGVCFECRATIDGHPQRKTCQVLVQAGMEVQVDDFT